ncbi:phosphotransferase [Spirillospora sp. NPDC048911]|uniref:phosphotransferase n=1 Tax=Spirillospora sp. NPDC048911 TaxID=3364527 RepID=UPI003716B2D6
MDRIEWGSLPPTLHDAVQDHIGPVIKAEPSPEGRRSALAATVHTRAGQRLFLKGAPIDNARSVGDLDREAAIAPYVTAIAPELVCDVTAAGWRLLAFDYVEGRRANYAPGSPDLPAVVEAVTALDTLSCPDEVPLKWFDARWSTYAADPRQLAVLAGTAVLHTDLNPGNLLVGPQTVTVVDWAMASRGAAFVNPADLVLNLIACGHAPAEAEAVVHEVAAWRDAEPEAVDHYARTVAVAWLQAFWSYTHPWARAVVRAAQHWALYRMAR